MKTIFKYLILSFIFIQIALANGIDTSFSTDGYDDNALTNDLVWKGKIHVSDDGIITQAGRVNQSGSAVRVIQYNADGSSKTLDKTVTYSIDHADGLAIDSDGNPVVSLTKPSGGGSQLIKLNSSTTDAASLVWNYAPSTSITNNYGGYTKKLSNGNFLVAGSSGNNLTMQSYKTDGTGTSYSKQHDLGIAPKVTYVHEDASQNIYIVALAGTTIKIIKTDSSGALDTSFGDASSGIYTYDTGTTIDFPGYWYKGMTSGFDGTYFYASVNHGSDAKIYKIDLSGNGSLFYTGTSVQIAGIDVDSHGNVYVVGIISSAFKVWRLKTSDGSVDEMFGTSGYENVPSASTDSSGLTGSGHCSIDVSNSGEYIAVGCDQFNISRYKATTSSNLTSGLVAHYRFEDNLNDSSTNNNNLEINGTTAAAYESGKYGKAYTFDGTNFLQSINALTYSDNGSVSFWIKDNTITTQMFLAVPSSLRLSGYSGYDFTVDAGGGSADQIDTTGIYDGNWHHVVVTFSGTTNQVYIDGVLKTFDDESENQNVSISASKIQLGHEDTDYPFIGSLDDVRVYNRILNSSDIYELYNNIASPFLTVSSTADSGANSLRQVIADADDGATIKFDPSIAGQTITLLSTISIDKNITIEGNVSNPMVIDGGDSVQLFNFSSAATFTISNMTLQNGRSTGGGGAIQINVSGATLNANNILFKNNIAQYGGAIHGGNGTMNFDGCHFTQNRISGTGGNDGGNAIYSGIPTTLKNSSITNHNLSHNSSIGIVALSGGNSEVYNTTCTDNYSYGYAGCFLIQGTGNKVENSTIVNNTANLYNGGGIRLVNGEVSIKNTVIYGNTAGGTGSQISFEGTTHTVTSLGYNYIGDTSLTAEFNQGTDVLSTDDPKLGTLMKDPDGITWAYPLTDDSPLIDAGNCTKIDGNTTTKDQFGDARNGTCDIGAMEYMDRPNIKLKSHGGALQFKGGGVSIPTPSELKNANKLTFEMWMYPWSNPTSGGTIFYLGENQYKTQIVYNSSTNLEVHLQNNAQGGSYGLSKATTTSTWNVDRWIHVAVVYDGTQVDETNGRIKLYVDGELQTLSFHNNYPLPSQTSNTSDADARIYPNNSLLDEFRIWTTAKTSAEINASMHKQLDGDETNLLLYYNFDERKGDKVYDLTGNHHASLETNVERINFLNDELDFDGTDDFIEIADSNDLDITTNITLSAWVKADNFAGGGTIFSKFYLSNGDPAYAYELLLNDNGTLLFNSHDQLTPQDSNSTTALTANVYNFVTVTYDGANVKFYINGELDRTVPTTGTLATSTAPLLIGKRYLSTADKRFFDGSISEATVWNKVLNINEIRHYMHSSPKGDETGLAGYWPLNEGIDNTLNDRQTNVTANNGTNNGATWKKSAPKVYGDTLYTAKNINTYERFTVEHNNSTPTFAYNGTAPSEISVFSSNGLFNYNAPSETNTTIDINATHDGVTLNKAFDVKVYPNPLNITLNLNNIKLSDNNITHIRLLGQDGISTNYEYNISSITDGNLTFNIGITQEGNYTLEFETDDGTTWYGNVNDSQLYSKNDGSDNFKSNLTLSNSIFDFNVTKASWNTIVDITSDLHAHYSFDTNLQDLVAGHTLNIGGDYNYTTGYAGRAMYQNSQTVSDQLLSHSRLTSGDYTFTFWLNAQNSRNPESCLIAMRASADMTICTHYNPSDANMFRMSLRSYNPSDGQQFIYTPYMPERDWHHIAIVQKGGPSNIKLYVNGVATSHSLPVPHNSYTASEHFFQFYNDDYPTYYDDMRVYNRALEKGDINELMDLYPNIENGLLAHYEFEDNMNDSSHRSNDANWSAGTASYTDTSKYGRAITLDGDVDVIQTPLNEADDLSGSWTKSLWLRLSSSQVGNTDLDMISSANYTMGAPSSASYKLSTPFNTVTTGPSMNDNYWRHLVVVYNDNNKTESIYIDGVLKTSSVITKPTLSQSNIISINSNDGTNPTGINGIMDDVRIYNRALKPADVVLLYNSMPPSFTQSSYTFYTTDEIAANSIMGQVSATDDNGSVEYSLEGDDKNYFTIDTSGYIKNVSQIDFDVKDTFSLTIVGRDQHGLKSRVPLSIIVNDIRVKAHGGILQLDSVLTNIETNSSLNLGSNHTMEFWIKTTDSDAQIVGLYDTTPSSKLYIDAGGKLTSQVIKDGSNSNIRTSLSSINDGIWHHIAMSYKNDGNVSLYIDGALDETYTTATIASVNLSSATLKIGGNGTNSSAKMLIDDVRVWNTTRTTDEINNNKNLQLKGDETGLVAYYNFDERVENKIYDITSNSYDGVIEGNVTRLNFLGKELSFNGSDSYIQMGDDNIEGLSNYTASAWINYNSLSGSYNYIISKAAVANMYLNNSGQLVASIGDGALIGSACTSTETLASNTFYHVASTYTSATNEVNLYINGKNIKTCTTNKTMGSNSNYRMIGAEDDTMGSHSPWGFFNGTISNVSIWDTTLNQNKIEYLMHSSLLGSESGLKGYWPLNEGSGTTANDKTSSYDGTIANGNWEINEPTIIGETIYTAKNIVSTEYFIAENNTSTATYGYAGTAPDEMSNYSPSTGHFNYLNTKDVNTTLTGGIVFGSSIIVNANIDVVVYNSPTSITLNLTNLNLADNNITKIQLLGQDGIDQNYTFNITSIADGNHSFSVDISQEGNYTIAFTTEDGKVWYGNVNDNKLYGQNLGDNFKSDLTFSNDTYNFDMGYANFNDNALNFTLKNHGGVVQSKDATSKIDIGSIANLSDAQTFTIEAWVNPRAYTQYDSIFQVYSGDSSKQINIQLNNNKWEAVLANSDLSLSSYGYASNTITYDTWQHIAYVYDGSQDTNETRIKLYVNGVEESLTFNMSVPTATPDFGTNTVKLGQFQGSVDEVRIWSTARTHNEILKNKNNQLDGNESGLLAYYNFDERVGNTVYDITSNNFNGTIEGNITRLNFLGDTLSFTADGSTEGDRVTISDTNDLDLVNTDFTISTWVKVAPDSQSGTVLIYKLNNTTADGYLMSLDSNDGHILFYSSGSRCENSTGQNLKDNQWHHTAVTFLNDTNEVKLYLDGELEATCIKSDIVATSQDILLGNQAAGVNDLNGSLAEVSIWNKVLSSDEIKHNMYSSLKGDEIGLIGYWPMSEGSGTTVNDKTTNGYNGTITGATWQQSAPSITGNTLYTTQGITSTHQVSLENNTSSVTYTYNTNVLDETFNFNATSATFQYKSSVETNQSITGITATQSGNTYNQSFNTVVYSNPNVSTITFNNLDIAEHNVSKVTFQIDDGTTNHVEVNTTNITNGHVLSTYLPLGKPYSIIFRTTSNGVDEQWWYNFNDGKLYFDVNESSVFTGTINITNKDIALNAANTNWVKKTYTDNLYVYIPDPDQDKVSIIDVVTKQEVKAITVGDYPLFTKASRDQTKLYVGNKDGNSISIINTLNQTVTTPITDIPQPGNMAISRDGNYLYVTTGVNASGGNGQSIYKVDLNTNTASSLATSVCTGAGSISPWGFDVSADGSKLYIPCSQDNVDNSPIKVVATSNGSVLKSIAAGDYMTQGQMSPDGKVFFAQERKQTHDTFMIDTTTDTLTDSFSTGSTSNNWQSAITADQTYIYVNHWTTIEKYDISKQTKVGDTINVTESGYFIRLSDNQRYLAWNAYNSSTKLTIYDLLLGTQDVIDYGEGTNGSVSPSFVRTPWSPPKVTLNLSNYNTSEHQINSLKLLGQDGLDKNISLDIASLTNGNNSLSTIYVHEGNYTIQINTTDGRVWYGNLDDLKLHRSYSNTATYKMNLTGSDVTYNFNLTNINWVNNVPTVSSTPIENINVGSEYNYKFEASDSDDNNFTWSSTTIPSWLSFDNNASVDFSLFATTPNWKPIDIAIDSNNTIYYIQYIRHAVKKIDSSGTITTFAGSADGNTPGDIQDTGVNARFDSPQAIAFDKNDTLYVLDTNNANIKKVTPAGDVTNFVTDIGGGNGITVDDNFNVYYTYNHAVYKVTPDGTSSLFAGSASTSGYEEGNRDIARFNNLKHIDIDSQGNLYIADSGNNAIRKIDVNGTVSTIAVHGSGHDFGTSLTVNIDEPSGLTVLNNDEIYFTSYNTGKIIKIRGNGDTQTIADHPNGAPRGLAGDSNNSIFIGTRNAQSIYKYSQNVPTLSGTPTYKDIGVHTVQVVVNDGLTTNTQEYNITVTAADNITFELTNYDTADKNITAITFISNDHNISMEKQPSGTSWIGGFEPNRNYKVRITLDGSDEWWMNFGIGGYYQTYADDGNYAITMSNGSIPIDVDKKTWVYSDVDINAFGVTLTDIKSQYQYQNNIVTNNSHSVDINITKKSGEISSTRLYFDTLAARESIAKVIPSVLGKNAYIENVVIGKPTLDTAYIIAANLDSNYEMKMSLQLDNNKIVAKLYLDDGSTQLTMKEEILHTVNETYFIGKTTYMNVWTSTNKVFANITDVNLNQIGKLFEYQVSELTGSSGISFTKHHLDAFINDTADGGSDTLQLSVQDLSLESTLDTKYFKTAEIVKENIEQTTFNSSSEINITNETLYSIYLDTNDSGYNQLNIEQYKIAPTTTYFSSAIIDSNNKIVLNSKLRDKNISYELKAISELNASELSAQYATKDLNLTFTTDSKGYVIYTKEKARTCEVVKQASDKTFNSFDDLMADFGNFMTTYTYLTNNKYYKVETALTLDPTSDSLAQVSPTSMGDSAGTWKKVDTVSCNDGNSSVTFDSVIEVNTTIRGYEGFALGYKDNKIYELNYMKENQTYKRYFLNSVAAKQIASHLGFATTPTLDYPISKMWTYISLPTDTNICTQAFQSLKGCNQDHTMESVFKNVDFVLKYNGDWSYWSDNNSSYNMNKLGSINSKDGLLIKSEFTTTLEVPYDILSDSKNELHDLYKNDWFLVGTQFGNSVEEIKTMAQDQNKTLNYILKLNGNDTWEVYAPNNDEQIDENLTRIEKINKEEAFWVNVE